MNLGPVAILPKPLHATMARKRHRERRRGEAPGRRLVAVDDILPNPLAPSPSTEELQQAVNSFPNAFMWMWQQSTLYGS